MQEEEQKENKAWAAWLLNIGCMPTVFYFKEKCTSLL